MAKYSALLVLTLLVVWPVYAQAQEYYADVQLRVMPTGEVAITGTTNYPALSPKVTQEFTDKTGTEWTINITFPDEFSEYVYDLSFPGTTQISYLNVSGNFHVETQNGEIHIIGSGTNQTFALVVKYGFPDNSGPPQPGPEIILIIVLIMAIGGFVVYLIMRRRHRILGKDGGRDMSGAPTYNPHALTDRQKQILEVLKKNGRPMTQGKIQEETKIPKASLSRNIDSLIKKGIIKKERKGMSMVVYFNNKSAAE